MESSLIEIQISGMSMYPTLRDGDICFMTDDKPCYADIVCLRNIQTKEFVIHRLHDTQKILTKGDNALYWDEPSEHVLMGTIRKFKRNHFTSRLLPNSRYAVLSKYTTKSTPKLIRLFIKVLMRII